MYFRFPPLSKFLIRNKIFFIICRDCTNYKNKTLQDGYRITQDFKFVYHGSCHLDQGLGLSLVVASLAVALIWTVSDQFWTLAACMKLQVHHETHHWRLVN